MFYDKSYDVKKLYYFYIVRNYNCVDDQEMENTQITTT